MSSIDSTNFKKNEIIDFDKINISFFGLLAFLCGLPILYTINLMGELYGTEVLLPIFTIILLFSNKEKRIFQEKIFWMFVLSIVVMMIGYIISDIVAGTSAHNYLRGWGRNAIFTLDAISLSIIAATDKRYLWWYIFGVSIGSIIYMQLTGVPFTHANWKLAYCVPILLLMLISVYFISDLLAVWLAIAVGIFSFYMDGRSMGSVCIFLAGIIFIRRSNPETLKISAKSLANIFIVGIIATLLIVIVLAQTNEGNSNRRDSSSLGRFAALRIGVIAISDSPILGYGSWGEGTKKYAHMLHLEIEAKLHELGQNNVPEGDFFLAHSQILQVWIEGGIFAEQLFLFYGYQIIVALKKTIFTRRFDYLSPFYCFYLLMSFWSLFMSPYNGGHRLGIAISIAIICALNTESTNERRKNNLNSNRTVKNSFL
jgi:hypothetical protein